VSEEISLGKAAELSELTYDKMLEEVRRRCLALSFGPQDLHEAQEEEKVLETYLKIRSREEARR
jgi:predicted HTH domain antitoxin